MQWLLIKNGETVIPPKPIQSKQWMDPIDVQLWFILLQKTV